METFKQHLKTEILTEEDLDYFKSYALVEKMFDFIEETVDIENLNDLQSDKFNDILISLEKIEDSDDLEETAIRKKISAADRRERKREYRKNKIALKRKAAKYRKTAKYKKYIKKAKKKAKIGKTATGKRQTTYI